MACSTKDGDTTIGEKIGCILSYEGSTKDVVINYSLLVLNLIWCTIALSLHTRDITRSTTLRIFAVCALVFVIVFQIGLCLLVDCYGISIIWCAMGGWILSERKRLRETSEDMVGWRKTMLLMERVVVMIDVGFIIYYAVVSDAITTVAHVGAMILGATLSLLSIRLFDVDDSTTDPVGVVGSSTALLRNQHPSDQQSNMQ